MSRYASEMAQCIGRNALLIEYGSGNGEKIRLLLNHLYHPAGYVPIDISRHYLEHTIEELPRHYPQLEVLPVYGDFTTPVNIPITAHPVRKRVIYFPGSTIGNFNHREALSLLQNMGRLLEPGDGLLIGIDLKKDEGVLTRAYNDQEGLTAAFNLNILHRINRELEGNFEPKWFNHLAFYNRLQDCMEMHLVSDRDHSVEVAGRSFHLDQGEPIHTESSYKYDVQEFSGLAGRADFQLIKGWSDPTGYYAVLYFVYDNFI